MKPFGIIFSIIMAAAVISCTEEIDLQLENDNQNLLVVEGMITTDTTAHQVLLTRTHDYKHVGSPPVVSGAQLSIWDDQGKVFPLTETVPGQYNTASDVYGLVGRTYTLEIKLDNQTYLARSTMKPVAEPDSLWYRYDTNKESFRILLYGQETPGMGDHYMWHLHKNGQWMTHSIDQVQVMNDEFVDGNYISGFEVDWWANDFDFQVGDLVTVSQHSITRQAFEFILAIQRESNPGGGFSLSPPANVQGNLSNGALGMFHASAITRLDILIEE